MLADTAQKPTFPAGEVSGVAVLGFEDAIDIQFGVIATEQNFHVIPLTAIFVLFTAVPAVK